MHPIYRGASQCNSAHPQNVLRTIAPQVHNLRSVIGHHFALRKQGPYRVHSCRAWIKELRRLDKACGWSACAKAVGATELERARPERQHERLDHYRRDYGIQHRAA